MVSAGLFDGADVCLLMGCQSEVCDGWFVRDRCSGRRIRVDANHLRCSQTSLVMRNVPWHLYACRWTAVATAEDANRMGYPTQNTAATERNCDALALVAGIHSIRHCDSAADVDARGIELRGVAF